MRPNKKALPEAFSSEVAPVRAGEGPLYTVARVYRALENATK
jgi:hypothetical protein